MPERRCLALLCAFDGAAFSGFQRQPPLPTVQGALEDALAAVGAKGRVEGAGRTDAGVHARRLPCTVRVRSSPDPARLPALLARHLPRGLCVLAARAAPMSFHARFSAVAKVYRYRVVAAEDASDWERATAWVLPDERGFPGVKGPLTTLNEPALASALEAMRGRHDFSALVHPGGEGKRVRLLPRIDLHAMPSSRGGRLYEITLAAPGFLRHQVRNVVGVAVSAGLGVLAPEDVPGLLVPDRDRWRGARAPGRGLTLWEVRYRAGEDPFPQSSPFDDVRGEDEGGD